MKKIFTLFAILILINMSIVPVKADEYLATNLPALEYSTLSNNDIYAEAAILINANSGQILYSKNIHEKLYPASITKILTAYLAITNLNLDDTLTATAEAIDSVPRSATHIAIDYGEIMTVKDLLYATLLESANDAANVLAIGVSGSITNFANLMNETVASLNLTDTHFTNANGLPDDDHYTTAYDMAVIMQFCLENETFKEIIETATYQTATTNSKDVPRYFANRFKMITNSQYNYEYALGGKTGYTDEARFTSVALAANDNISLIAVTLKDQVEDEKYDDLETLFNYGLNNFAIKTLNKNNITINSFSFSDQVITFSLDNNLQLLVTNDQDTSKELTQSIEIINEDDPDTISAILHIFYDDQEISEYSLTKTSRLLTNGYQTPDNKLTIIKLFNYLSLLIFLLLAYHFINLNFLHIKDKKIQI